MCEATTRASVPRLYCGTSRQSRVHSGVVWPFLAASARTALLVAALLLTGCHTVYRNAAPTFVPQSAYVPMLPRPGAEASLTLGALGLEGQMALAPAANLVFTAQGQHYRTDKNRDRFQAVELGFGIIPWRSATTMVGLFAGAGVGQGMSAGAFHETWSGVNSLRYDSTDRQATATYRTFYLMPVVGWYYPDEHLEFAFAAKLYRLDYKQIDYAEQSRRGERLSGVVHEDAATTAQTSIRAVHRVHVQVVGQLGLGLGVVPRLKAHLQLGLDFDVRHQNRFYHYQPFVASVGLRYRLGRIQSAGPR